MSAPSSPSNAPKPTRTITPQMMISASNLRAPREGGVDKFLKKLTHLNLNDKRLDSMEGLSVCKSLKNLYLYNNSITKIDNIRGFKNLTHLYLENNQIEAIDNLPTASLQKLYINENSISVVDNLQECCNLTELHVASQRLPPSMPLRFASAVLDTISHSLTVLNISNNNINTVVDVLILPNLVKLNISKNNITNMDMALALMQLEMLQDLDMRGNPVTAMAKYTENLVANSPQYLDRLDGKEVVQNHREMLKNLVSFKSRGMRSNQMGQMDGGQMGQMDGGYGDMGGEGGMQGMGYGGGGGGDYGGEGGSDWAVEGEGAIDYVGGEFR